MARRSQHQSTAIDDLFALLSNSPIWAGPIVAAFVYAMSRWVVPWLFRVMLSGNKFGEGMSQPFIIFAERVAPYLAAGVLIIWVVAEVKKRIDRRRFDHVSGSASINELHWREFESLLSEAFRRQGFAIEHTGRDGPDGGIDIRLDKAGSVTLVQCKHWKRQQVGVQIVRELLGVVTSEGAQSGIVVTSGQFSHAAIEFAEKNPIRLIDGRELVQMVSEVQTSGRIEEQRANDAGPVALAAHASAPTCPQCGAVLVQRTAKRGARAGSNFLGCSQFPKCNYTRDMVT